MLFSARTNDVIELNVINGTLNLNLGGNVDAFEAVIGEPPATSSELTLIQALGKINQVLQKILSIKLITGSGYHYCFHMFYYSILMSLVAHRFGRVEFKVSNICFYFFKCTCLKKTTTNIRNLTLPNR